ncbi:hypothetical protein GN956_G7835 [Arapaima gigas]
MTEKLGKSHPQLGAKERVSPPSAAGGESTAPGLRFITHWRGFGPRPGRHMVIIRPLPGVFLCSVTGARLATHVSDDSGVFIQNLPVEARRGAARRAASGGSEERSAAPGGGEEEPLSRALCPACLRREHEKMSTSWIDSLKGPTQQLQWIQEARGSMETQERYLWLWGYTSGSHWSPR